MRQTVNKYQFNDIMTKHGFSYDGANALFEWLEEYEESTGQELELDPIGFSLDFKEYESLEELKKDYDVQKLHEYGTLIDYGAGYIVHEWG